mgnify:FL=1
MLLDKPADSCTQLQSTFNNWLNRNFDVAARILFLPYSLLSRVAQQRKTLSAS